VRYTGVSDEEKQGWQKKGKIMGVFYGTECWLMGLKMK
jgi:hypothetical protein